MITLSCVSLQLFFQGGNYDCSLLRESVIALSNMRYKQSRQIINYSL